MTGIEQLQSIGDPGELLATGRSLLLAAHEKSRHIVEDCANEISDIWYYIKDRGQQDPRLGLLIRDWQQSIYTSIPPKEIRQQLARAERSRRRRARLEGRVRMSWGVSSHDALGLGPNDLSLHILQYLAPLAKLVGLREGSRRIRDQVSDRLQAVKKGHGWRETKIPTTQDIKAVLDQVKTTKEAKSGSESKSIDAPLIKVLCGPSEIGDTECSLPPQQLPAVDDDIYLSPHRNSDQGSYVDEHDFPTRSQETAGGRPQKNSAGPHSTVRIKKKCSLPTLHTKTEDQLSRREHGDRHSTPELARTAATPVNTDGDSLMNDGDQFGDGLLSCSPSLSYIFSDQDAEHNDAADILDQIACHDSDGTFPSFEPPAKRRKLSPIIEIDDSIHRTPPQSALDTSLISTPNSHSQACSTLGSDRHGGGEISQTVSASADDGQDNFVSLPPERYKAQPSIYTHRSSPSKSERVLCQDAVEQQIPTTDTDGAWSSLNDRCLVSASAIEIILSTCNSPVIKVFDPQAWSLSEPDALKSFKIDIAVLTLVLLPLHKDNHWTLAVFDLHCFRVWYYDSLVDGLSQTQIPTAIRQSLEIFLGSLGVDLDGWTFSYGIGPIQNNDYDCGIHLLVTALHAITGSKRRIADDCDLWRIIFQCVLSPPDHSDIAFPGYKKEPTVSVDCEDLSATFAATNVQKQRLSRAKEGRVSAVAAFDMMAVLTDQMFAEISKIAATRDRVASDESQLMDIVLRYSSLGTALKKSSLLLLRSETECANESRKTVEHRLTKAHENANRWSIAREALDRNISSKTEHIDHVIYGISRLKARLEAHHQQQEEAAKRRIEILEDLETMMSD